MGNAKINNHPLQAFVDSGAQMTVMSKTSAKRCGILHLLDTRFAGVAVGVGTGKILGRIHCVQLTISNQDGVNYHFPCTVTVMEDNNSGRKSKNSSSISGSSISGSDNPHVGIGSNMDFLLGLDMLKRHTCSIDLESHVLKFRLGLGQSMETPFLHEKDLDQSKGGTKGFNANQANEELLKAQQEKIEAASRDGKGEE